MTATLLDLGDATSRNLDFSQRANVWVSYGEETITETNLLAIRRRQTARLGGQTKRKSARIARSATRHRSTWQTVQGRHAGPDTTESGFFDPRWSKIRGMSRPSMH